MDLDTITAILAPRSREQLPARRVGDAWLAGGTWLFSEPQPALSRLVDLSAMRWPAVTISEAGLTLSATCTIAEFNRSDWPADWTATTLVGPCCAALLGSFKIWNRATVGGNLCLALPAAPMIALSVALDGIAVVWGSDGSERRVPVLDMVLGPQRTSLASDELLRSVEIPRAALRRRSAFRRLSLSPNGRSGALLIGTRDVSGAFALTITASTPRPRQLTFPAAPPATALRDAIAAAIPSDGWYDDVHGAPDWRRHVTGLLAEEIRQELGS